MSKIGIAAFLVLLVSLLSSCSDHVAVTYKCFPEGAKILQPDIGGVGTCPMTVAYNTNDIKVRDGKLFMDKIIVFWPSGASFVQPATAVDIPPGGRIVMAFTRPHDYPYMKRDLDHAIAFEQYPAAMEVRYVVSPQQDKDFFAAFNRATTCAFGGLFHFSGVMCP